MIGDSLLSEGETVKVDLNGHDVSTLTSITSPQPERSGAAALPDPDADHPMGEDKATLSGDRVTALTAEVLGFAEVRQAKVEALRQAIQNGDYTIEPSKIAEAMIRQSE